MQSESAGFRTRSAVMTRNTKINECTYCGLYTQDYGVLVVIHNLFTSLFSPASLTNKGQGLTIFSARFFNNLNIVDELYLLFPRSGVTHISS